MDWHRISLTFRSIQVEGFGSEISLRTDEQSIVENS